MGLAPLTFTGVSSYSSDFQTILSRAKQIASMPLTALQNEQSDVQQKKMQTSTLQSVVSSLSNAFTALGKVGDNKALQASSSDTSKVAIVSTNADSPATYTISNITSVAKVASETSLSGYADPAATKVSSNGDLTLTVGSTTYPIHLTDDTNNLQGLRDAINASGAPVSASVLTTGTGADPNYLSVSADSSGATTLKLVDNTGAATPPDVLTDNNQGANAEFELNGIPVSKSSNLINDVIPGVSFNITGTTDSNGSVTISVATDRTQLSSALQSLVGAYNSAVSIVDTQIGPSAGLLSGDSIITQLSSTFRQFSSFSGTGSIKGLADLGLQFSQTGELSFDPTTFAALSDAQINDGLNFVNSSVGLGSFAAKFNEVSDPVSGLIKLEQDQYTQTNLRLTDQISTVTDQINAMQSALADQLHAADALLASLSSQQNVLTAEIQGLNLTMYGKQQQ